ncbi:MAG: hypothetical protein PHU46_02460 [Rhodocyclaceae bacterium]|nr:hypothetical protein [Rhodocyclaceae bacterium]
MIADPVAYDGWYGSPRGRWIGDTEYRLLRRMLEPRPGETILDAGCGTGYFARRFRADGSSVVGEALALFSDLPVSEVRAASAILLPGGGMTARCLERLWPKQCSRGSFLALSVSCSSAHR